MFLQFIIDGYNIINHPQFRRTHKKIKTPCLELLEFIRIKRLCGSPKNKITVVFDGYPNAQELKGIDTNNIEIIFARKEKADERIRKILENSGNPKNIVVVSDDKEIKFFVKSLGGKMLSVEEFIVPKERARDNKENELKTELTYTQMHLINQELKRLWLGG